MVEWQGVPYARGYPMPGVPLNPNLEGNASNSCFLVTFDYISIVIFVIEWAPSTIAPGPSPIVIDNDVLLVRP